MRCLVTGAAGFIGSHLCEGLLEDGHEVIGFDDLSTGRLTNLDTFKGHPKFVFIRGSVTEPIIVKSMEGVDWCFHLAALADIVPSIETPIKYHNANVTGTIATLEAARKHRVKRFIYAASNSCYGIPNKYPTPETAKCRPMYPYALTKFAGEQYVMHWAKTYKLPAVSLRLFNVYGPRSRTTGSYGAVFGTFLAQIANGQPLTIVGDGDQSRDFTYVTDVVDAFVKAAHSEISGEKFNICTGQSQTINWLVALLGAKEKVHIPDRPGEPNMTHGSFEKALRLLGWHPTTTFVEGVEMMKDLTPQFKDAPVWTPSKIAEATKVWHEALS